MISFGNLYLGTKQLTISALISLNLVEENILLFDNKTCPALAVTKIRSLTSLTRLGVLTQLGRLFKACGGNIFGPFF